MGLPSKKRTKQQKRQRRGNISLSGIVLTTGEKGDAVKRPHRVSPESGFYKGRDVLKLALKAERKKLREKKREKKASS